LSELGWRGLSRAAGPDVAHALLAAACPWLSEPRLNRVRRSAARLSQNGTELGHGHQRLAGFDGEWRPQHMNTAAFKLSRGLRPDFLDSQQTAPATVAFR
jgi:hypothetical protein